MLTRDQLKRKAALRMIFSYGGRLLQIVLTPFLAYWFVNWFRGDELVEVTPATTLQGQITKCDVNRQHYYWYLNNEPVRYDLWSFVAGDSATLRMQKQLEARADPDYYYNTLAYYLKTGARLRKKANSRLITVVQDNKVTVWTYEQ
ncbi:hypothetical protein [Hymenobacter sp.]|jgi:hypothetical protein|uniref:hypothetical protein n=1 Tax=Hymenobacter sp. TaxID=1898978 RepID=UPI002ED814DF